MPTCPVCGQALADPNAVSRVQANLEKLRNAEQQRHAAEMRRIRVRAAREAADAARSAKRQAEQQAKARFDAEKKRHRLEIQTASAEARLIEQRHHSRELDAMRKQMAEYQRRLEKMTADERGEFGESEILQALQTAFPYDKIEGLGRGRESADVRHEVRERGKTCGVIIYECKNVSKWSNSCIAQARTSRSFHRAAHAVVVTTAFPKGQKHFCFVRDVAVVHPAIVTSVVRCLRQALVVAAGNTGTVAERERRADKLLQYVRGDDFKRHLTSVADAIVDLRALQAKESQAHHRVWEEQRGLFDTIEAGNTKVQTRIQSIAEGTGVAAIPEIAAG